MKEKYLQKIEFDLDTYLYIDPFYFKKDYLTNEYNEFFKSKKLNKEIIEKIIYDIFENKTIKDIDEEDVDKIKENQKLINIDSPLFNIFSKSKNFSKIFTIHISQKIIDKYNLKEDYIKFFDNLNKMDIKYASIFYILKDMNKINYLKEFNINFNKIKRLTIKFENYYAIQNEIENFFETFFSFDNIENNLIYLYIKFINYEINNELFAKINNFKLLKFLYLVNFNFKRDLLLYLNNLKLITIISCKNIQISGNSNEKLKELNLNNNKISSVNFLKK